MQNRVMLLENVLSIMKRGTQCKNVLFNVKTCYSVQKHVIKSEKRGEKCKSPLKDVIQHENALNNMFFALDNTLFALDNKFDALDSTFYVSDNTFLRWINQKQKRVIQFGIYFIQRKYVSSTANTCYPMWINVIQQENLLYNANTYYPK